MPTKRITRIHSPDSVDDKKLVKNEAENGQLWVKKLQKNLKFYKTFRSLDLLQLQKSR